MCDMCGCLVEGSGWVLCPACSDRDDDQHGEVQRERDALRSRVANLENATREFCLRVRYQRSDDEWLASKIDAFLARAGLDEEEVEP